MSKIIRIYVDMDGVLADFDSALKKCTRETLQMYAGEYDNIPGLFALMDPMPGALEAMKFLDEHFDVYILSTAPWGNPTAWGDKLLWVKKYLPQFEKRLILSHRKDLCKGDFIIDDRDKNGVADFDGIHVPFGMKDYANWEEVIFYFQHHFFLVKE